MQKDFKIGMLVGMIVLVCAALWLSSRPGLSPQARMGNSHSKETQQNSDKSQDVTNKQRNLSTPTSNISDRPTNNAQPSSATSQIKPTSFTVEEKSEKIKTQKFHIVRKGETLSSISAKYYGSVNQWPKIFKANRDTIKDADKITPGTKLIIPD